MVTFQFDWVFTWEVFLVCMKQVTVCFFAATAAMLTGLVLGIPLAAARNKKKWFRYLANAYVHLIRGIPTILLLLIGYIGVVDIVQAGKIKATLSHNNMEAYLAEVLIYWGMTVLLERLFALLSRRIGRKNGLEAAG